MSGVSFGPDPIATEGIVVKFLLTRSANEQGLGFTPLKINKLAYICHGWTLAGLDHPLFNNTFGQIEAWKYGPVVVRIYDLLKPFGRSPVTLDKLANASKNGANRDLAHSDYESVIEANVDGVMNHNERLRKTLNWVFDVYSGFSGGELINMTHKRGTPWDQCRARGLGRLGLSSRGSHIPDQVIRSYYIDLGKRLSLRA